MAQPDVYDFATSCGIQSERFGSGPGCFGSVLILLLELVVCRKKVFIATHKCPLFSESICIES